MRRSPTSEELEGNEFACIWRATGEWDIQSEPGEGYAGMTGTDVAKILDSLSKGHCRPYQAVFAFAAWLTTRKERVMFSSADDASVAAELAKEFCEDRGYLAPVETRDT